MSKLETVYRIACNTGHGCITAEAKNTGHNRTQISLRPMEIQDCDGDLQVAHLDDELSESYVDKVIEIEFNLNPEGLRSLAELLNTMAAQQETKRLTA